MNTFKKWLAGILATLTLLMSAISFTGCSQPSENPSENNGTHEVTTTESAGNESDTVVADTRFEDVDYGGRPFRIYTSTNAASVGMGNSNFLIEGEEKLNGGLVNDAVHERNIKVEESLGVTLEFIQVDKFYIDVASDIRIIAQAGDDIYDLIINDLFGFVPLSIEGQFRNILSEDCVFDFNRPYWYKDYMEDLRLMNGYQHLLAGDYFIDIIRSAHLLLLNKQLYEDYYQRDPDELYDIVINYEWTFDKMATLVSGVYADTNANGIKDKGDQFGFITPAYWGSSIAYSISGDPSFIERDENGIPTVILSQGDRANQLTTAMSHIFNSANSSIGNTTDEELLQAFVNNECLFVDYQRLGSLENEILRNMKGDACVLPLPLLFSSDKKYVTSAHDTTEVGAILITSTDLEYISTVIEVLNRETANILMPKYYKEGLQVQYVDDSKAAQMIDIIHDNFDNSFALAYNEVLGSIMLQSFSDAMEDKREFSAVYVARKESRVNDNLEQKIASFLKNNTDD